MICVGCKQAADANPGKAHDPDVCANYKRPATKTYCDCQHQKPNPLTPPATGPAGE